MDKKLYIPFFFLLLGAPAFSQATKQEQHIRQWSVSASDIDAAVQAQGLNGDAVGYQYDKLDADYPDLKDWYFKDVYSIFFVSAHTVCAPSKDRCYGEDERCA
jgi:hypothetical protein